MEETIFLCSCRVWGGDTIPAVVLLAASPLETLSFSDGLVDDEAVVFVLVPD